MFFIFEMFLAMGIGWAIYGSFTILTRKDTNKRDTYSAFFVLLCFSIHIIDHLIRPSIGNMNLTFPIIFFTRNIYYITGPILLYYANSLLKKDNMKVGVFLIHSIPFIVWVVLSFIYGEDFYRIVMRINYEIQNLHLPPKWAYKPSVLTSLRVHGSFISILVYSIYILFIIRKHRKKVVDYYSDKNINNTLIWLTILITGMVLLSLYYLSFPIRNSFLELPRKNNPMRLLSILPVILIFYFSYFAREQVVPKDIESVNNNEINDNSQSKYEKSELSQSERISIYNKLLEIMVEKRLHLNSEITIDDLSKEVQVSKHNLSQVINRETGDNFYSFINKYRLEEFKEAIKENRYPNFTLISIALECGFRSSSSFYSVFKKETGLTPKQFIDSLKV